MRDQLRGTSQRKGPRSRRWVLKHIFERRSAELDAVRASAGWPYSPAESSAYGVAVANYIEARNAWRRIRGWN